MSQGPPEIVVTHLANSSMAGNEQTFAQPKISIGRDGGTDIDFDPDEDLYVSRRHAEIYVEQGKLLVRDLDSRNGTYVNQRRITTPTPIGPNDMIHFGANGPLVKARLGGTAETMFEPSPPEQVDVQKTMAVSSPPKAATRRVSSAGVVPPQAMPSFPGEAPAGMPVSAPTGPEINVQAESSPMAGILKVLVFLVLGVAAGIGGLLAYNHYQGDHGPAAAAPAATEAAAPGGVAALGRLLPDGGLLGVTGTPGLTVKKVLVSEGQEVDLDQPLANLSSYDALKAEYEAAETALADAKAQSEATKNYAAALVGEARAAVTQTERPLDLEVDGVQAQIALAESNLNVASDDRKQIEALGQAANSTQLSRQRMVEESAQRDLTAAQKRLEVLRGSLEPKRAQARAQLATAQSNQARLELSISVAAAEKNVERAKAHLDQALVRAPRKGKVLRIVTKEGAALGTAPLLYMGDTDRLEVVAEIYESDVKKVAKGQPASISGPALPEKIRGQVSDIGWTVQTNAVRSLDPTAAEDLRVVTAHIRIDDGELKKHKDLLERLINLQVDVRITTD